jgi:UDP-2-acetamido-3-amino-2,3-dideoxy-glucuronate N-acetyltransferase
LRAVAYQNFKVSLRVKKENEMERNIAVIGCGYWGKNLVRNFYELNSLHSVCDIDEKKIKSLQEKHKEISFSYDYRQIIKNPQVKALVISTPAVSHFQIAKEALLANKDVFVEKPLALNYREGEELVALAEEKARVLMVGHILEYHPAVIKLKELVNTGELGNIKYIYSNRLNLGKFRTEENILWSFAPHDISVILDLLEEMPVEVSAHGANYLEPNITDVTVTTMAFPSGVKTHLFVSWLHPYKEQKLIVIGGRKMVMFDNVNTKGRLFLYSHKIDWIDRIPVPRPEDALPIEVEGKEPLRMECEHFIECLISRKPPKTDGRSALRVLKVLEACQESIKENGKIHSLLKEKGERKNYFVHENAIVDDNVEIGGGTKIWHFSHILKNTKIGKNCSLGQNVVIGPNVVIGHNVKIQNNVSVYDGVTLEDDVFCGPSMVFTNVTNPRSHWPRKDEYKKTLVKKGASIGANSTVVCGHVVGKYAFVGAGALVNKDVPDYALVYGVPAQIEGWMCYCGIKLNFSALSAREEVAECANCGRKYNKQSLIVHEIEQT